MCMSVRLTYRSLSTWIKRSIVVGYIVWLIISLINIVTIAHYFDDLFGSAIFADLLALFHSLFGYWLIVLIVLWVYDGYKSE